MITKEYVKKYTDMYLNTIQVDSSDLLSLLEECADLRAKCQYLLSNFIMSDEGLFCFPDGDTWRCKEREPHS